MEDIEGIKTNIRGFLSRYLDIPETDTNIDLNLEKLDGLSNVNYHVIVKRENSSESLIELVYRKFGEISECVDRELETMIINTMAEKGMGPKILEIDSDMKYRIDEYLTNTSTIPREKQYDRSILEQVSNIDISYHQIASWYKFTVEQKETNEYIAKYTCATQSPKNNIRVNQNMFDMCMTHMYDKAIAMFEQFAIDFRAKMNKEHNRVEYDKFEKFEYYMTNYKSLFTSVYPKNGFVVLTHNDVHRLNLIVHRESQKTFILDHEYASLNLIGNDIANYMNETNFNYCPEYFFKPEDINFDWYYDMYKTYIEGFKANYKEMFQFDEGRKYYDQIKTRKYYINLHRILNLFWLLYCAIYLNFAEYSENEGSWSYFQHGIDRIVYFEEADKEIKKC